MRKEKQVSKNWGEREQKKKRLKERKRERETGRHIQMNQIKIIEK